MVTGHRENGTFHPHDSKKGVHSSSVNSNTLVTSTSFEKHGKRINSNNDRDNFNKEKIKSLKMALDDADRRYEIGTNKMSAITDRIHEIEVERNQSLKRNLILDELQKTNDPVVIEHLQDELRSLPIDETRDEVYREIMIGYKPMSRRKNELQEERNSYVSEIEQLERGMN